MELKRSLTVKRGFEHLSFFFGKRDKRSCSASAIISLSVDSIVDSLLSTLHASANRILRCEANDYFIGSGYAGRTSRKSGKSGLLGLPPSFLASCGFAARHSRACVLPLLNLRKKRGCSQSNIKYAEMEVWSLFKYIVILRKRGNLISVTLEMHLIYFSISEAYNHNSKSNEIFMRNLLKVFLPPVMQ